MSSNGWKKVKLKDCARFQEGYVNPSQSVSEYFGDEIKWLRANDLNNSFVYETSRKLSRKGFESAGKSALLFKPNTLAISKSGTIGRLGILKDYMCGNRAVINIEIENEVSSTMFIFYSLLFRKNLIEQLGTGSVQKNLYISVLGDLEIDLPPLSTQQRIVEILFALDEKIEINRQNNVTLETIAQSIFREWFVEFNFLRADGEMEESEIGMIPRGWQVGSILEIANLLSGGTPSTQVAEYWDGQIKWVSAKDVSNAQGTFVLDTERKISQTGVDNSSTKLLPALTTIVTARGTVGSYCILSEPMTMNQTNYGLKAKKENTDYFVFFSLSNLVAHLRQVSYGTIFDTVTTKTFEQSRIVIPPIPEIQEFDSRVEPIMQSILNNLQQSATLASLRDALLPKLLNGELDL